MKLASTVSAALVALVLVASQASCTPSVRTEPPGRASVEKQAEKQVLTQARRPASAADHVLIVSIDGGKPAVIQGLIEEKRLPVLARLVSEGASSWKARTIFPSLTLPSHGSMLTGVLPEKHLLLWNDFEPSRGVVQVPTVFSEARAAGLSTALIAGKEKFKHLNVPGSVDHFQVLDAPAAQLGEAAAQLIRAAKPNLVFVHFRDADRAGHSKGWGSPEQKLALEQVDASLGRLIQALEDSGIRERASVIVSADHGGTGQGHGSDKDSDMQIPWILWGAGAKSGATIDAPVSTMDTAATALTLLGAKVPEGWTGKPVAP